jgi:glycosyl hydrolase family 20
MTTICKHRCHGQQIVQFLGGMLLCSLSLRGVDRIIPTPQYFEPTNESLAIAHTGSLKIILAAGKESASEKLTVAADFLRRDLKEDDPSIRVELATGTGTPPGSKRIYLWDYRVDRDPPLGLNFLDREILADPNLFGQSYVIRTPDKDSMWVVGSTDEGVLLGVMSVLQLIQKSSDGVEIPGGYIRDYPDFQYRAAASWLLNGESSRWSLERGQGIEGYKRLCERKLDEALRYKINLVVFDGFGWGLKQRFAGYGELMRTLNRYARARGIHLLYGGYGASYGITYQTGPLYEAQSYLGEVFKNREWYPEGPTYECMGFPGAKKGVNPKILGSCRANDALNRLKSEELRNFVATVEPGALYIHHEDFGDIQETAAAWGERCERCRRRWPNDCLEAPDGGAGGLAHGYSALIQAVNSVKNPADGYDASRDCLIILVSPVYYANSRSSDDWANALELWKNIGVKLPKANNVQVCFREIFPEKYGGRPWVSAFNSVMRNAGLRLGTYLFFLGGANSYSTDNPLSGDPALDAIFRGATGIYNFSGDFYTEPMQIINAEYGWNTRSNGFFKDPVQYDAVKRLAEQYMSEEGEPPELFGPGSIYEVACNRLYGRQTGPIMARYYRESAGVPEVPVSGGLQNLPPSIRSSYLPMMWDRSYAVPRLWRDLAIDAETWGKEISNERYVKLMSRLRLSPEEVHHRLVQHWTVLEGLNRRGAEDIEKALKAGPRPSCIEDLEFLKTSFQVDRRLIQALVAFHSGMEMHLASPPDERGAEQEFRNALAEAERAHDLAVHAWGPPIDPAGGEIGAIQTYSARLAKAIEGVLR